MQKFVKQLLRILIGRYVDTQLDLIKIEAATQYVKSVDHIRRIIIVLAVRLFLIVILAGGLILLPLALCFFMPWTDQTRAIVAICFAAAYIVIPLIALKIAHSERLWMRLSRANELVRKVTK